MLRDMAMTIKRKFSDRKLFTCGSFNLSKSKGAFTIHDVDNLLIEHHTDIISLWPTDAYSFSRNIKYV